MSAGLSLRSVRLPIGRARVLQALSLGVIAGWIATAVFAPSLAPFDPDTQMVPFASPGSRWPQGGSFLLGTDHLGRDVLSRVIYGARTVLTYAPAATLLAYAVGLVGGLIAGYRGGRTDEVLSQAASFVMSFPVMVLYLLLISRWGASTSTIMLAVVVGGAPGIMRLVRGLVISERERAYVAAARMRGEASWYVMAVEILPNIRGPLLVDLCLRLSYVIVTIGTLGFLGLGLPPPHADWGGMINETRNFAMVFPAMVVAPCIAIVSLIVGINVLADTLQQESAA